MSDVHGLPDHPCSAMCLPAYDGEAVHTDRMSDGLAVLVDGGRCSLSLSPKVLFNSTMYSSSAWVHLYP